MVSEVSYVYLYVGMRRFARRTVGDNDPKISVNGPWKCPGNMAGVNLGTPIYTVFRICY